MKLIVSQDKQVEELLGNPLLLGEEENKKDELTVKQKIKSIPFLGWLLRWSYNLLRLNNIKHNVYKHQHILNEMQNKINEQEVQILDLQHLIHIQQNEIEKRQKYIEEKLYKQLSYQSDSLNERIDQFIHDNKIDSKLLDEKI
jgi:hypothetical protein